MFRPCRFSRLRRLTPHSALQAYCILHPTIGFAWLHRGWSPKAPFSDSPERRCTPRSVSLLASRAAVTRHRQVHSASPTDRPLTPLLRCPPACCHTFRPPSLDLRVLIRQRVRCSSITVASNSELDAPWAYGLIRHQHPSSMSSRPRVATRRLRRTTKPTDSTR
jgi:hypothetical protein